jgi:PAS domain S-box-containing protein
VRERLRGMIEESSPVTVVGEAESVAQARLLFDRHAPDAVVLDLQLADGLAYPLIEEFKRSRPHCAVIVLSNFAQPAHRERCAQLGADHFFAKSSEFERIGELLSSWSGFWVETTPDTLDQADAAAAAPPSAPARAQTEQLLQRALDASRLAVWDLNLDSGRIELSAGWSQMLGGPAEPTVTTFGALARLVPTEDQLRIVAAMNPAIKGSTQTYSVDHRVRRPDGDDIWILSEGEVVERGPRGHAARAIGTNRDITERKRAELALRESEARYRELVELAADWYWEQDDQFRFTRLSSHEDYLAGSSEAAHIGKARWELPHLGVTDDAWRRHRAQLLRREPFRDFEYGRHDANGKLHTIAVSGAPRFDAAGRFLGYRGVTRDITAQRAAEASARSLEAQLHEAHKLEALGALAGGIAHDFNNIVGAILGNVALAHEDIVAGRDGLQALEQVRRVALRARTLTRQILNFSRRQPHVHVNQAVRPLVEEALSMLRTMLPRTVTLHASLCEQALDVRADSTQLQQVLINLCVNAAHALDRTAGRIDIELEEAVLEAPRPAVVGHLAPGRYARLLVRDNGHGMDAATQARIFEPFFTTKVQGQGTGLGLAIVRNIVTAHHGAIGLVSAPGQGATFSVYLPAVDHETGAMPLDLAEPAVPRGDAQRVLVVDDDEVTGLLITTLLERAGYRVSCIADAREALVGACSPAVDLVITDHRMSEMSGLDLAHNLAALRPGLPVILTTGLVTDELRIEARRAGLRALLKKENLVEQLLTVVHAALSEPGRTPMFDLPTIL